MQQETTFIQSCTQTSQSKQTTWRTASGRDAPQLSTSVTSIYTERNEYLQSIYSTATARRHTGYWRQMASAMSGNVSGRG